VGLATVRTELQRDGVLSGVGMSLALVHLQALQHTTRGAGLGKHAANREHQDLFRVVGMQGRKAEFLQTTDEAGVEAVDLAFGLVAGDDQLLDVGDNDEVALVNGTRVGGLALAHQGLRDANRDVAEDFTFGAGDVPVAFGGFEFGVGV
jgi:hypothetical protein